MAIVTCTVNESRLISSQPVGPILVQDLESSLKPAPEVIKNILNIKN